MRFYAFTTYCCSKIYTQKTSIWVDAKMDRHRSHSQQNKKTPNPAD